MDAPITARTGRRAICESGALGRELMPLWHLPCGQSSAGYSPALGFVHTGKQLSFVYDIADLYKAEFTIPASFAAVAEGTRMLDTAVRWKCRDLFHEKRLLARIVDDIANVLSVADGEDSTTMDELVVDEDMALPGEIWDPSGDVDGGVNYGEEPETGANQP